MTETKCPYEKYIKDESSNEQVINDCWTAYHLGYEAHKFEMAKLAESLESLAKELEAEVKEVNEIRAELKAQREAVNGK